MMNLIICQLVSETHRVGQAIATHPLKDLVSCIPSHDQPAQVPISIGHDELVCSLPSSISHTIEVRCVARFSSSRGRTRYPLMLSVFVDGYDALPVKPSRLYQIIGIIYYTCTTLHRVAH